MRKNKLEELVESFDDAFNGVDLTNIPDVDSEEYRVLVLKTANDKVFCDGSYKNLCAWKLDVLYIDDYDDALKSVADINALSDDERMRLRFYLDVKSVCFPLLNGDEIEWSAWPWNMEEGCTNSLCEGKLFDFITQGEYWNLSAAICLYLKGRVIEDNELFTSVAKQDVSHNYVYGVKSKWTEEQTKCKDGMLALASAVQSFASDLSSIENHLLVGRMLGLDYLAQSVYDAMDTFIDREYGRNLILFAREMGEWIKQNWDMSDANPSKDALQDLWRALLGLMGKYKVESPDFDFTWNILTLDVLGVEMDYGSGMGENDPWRCDDDEWDDEDQDSDGNITLND